MSFVFTSVFAYLAFSSLQFSSVAAQDIALCGASDWYNSTTVPYSFNNNAWGNDSSGYQCLDLKNGGSSWSVTYKWTGDASTVKGFPYMKVFPWNLPTRLKDVSRLVLAGDWSTYVTSTQNASPAQQVQAVDKIALLSNVAVDMFLSDNAANSTGLGSPIEIMIWPWWCPGVKPLGWTESTPQTDTVNVNGTDFSLYHGFNDGGQHVFSWLAQKNMTSANADYSPLLKYIWQKGLLSGDLWLGQLEFGTEIKHAVEETRFVANNMQLQLIRKGDPGDVTTTSTTMSSTSSSTTVSSTSIRPSTSVLAASTTATTTPATTSSSGAAHSGSSQSWSLLAGLLSFAIGFC